MSVLIPALAVSLLIPAVLVGGYYFALALVAFAPRRRTTLSPNTGLRFTILIPAHDEEAIIGDALAACRELDYPAANFRCAVLADNCTDATVAIARRAGAMVLERRDRARFGKGQALAWAIPQLMESDAEVVVILDADCRPRSNMLREMAAAFADGATVAQASYVLSNPDANSASCLAALGNRMENDFFYAPKERLGLAIFLRGTGMAFHRNVLTSIPWSAMSAVEDHEYTVRLMMAGHRIRFLDRTAVESRAMESNRAMSVQRRRWADSLGNSLAIAIRFAAAGVRQRRMWLVDAGLTQLALSRPMVLIQWIAATNCTALWQFAEPSNWSRWALAACAIVAMMHAACLVMGAVRLGITRRRLTLLASAGPSAAALMFATFRGAFGQRSTWLATRRAAGI